MTPGDMMTRIAFIFGLILFALPQLAHAEEALLKLPASSVDTRPQGKNFGIGLSLGGPTGLAFKYHLAPGSAVQVGVGGAGHGWLSLHLDYVFALAKLVEAQNAGMLYLYAGGGVGVGLLGNNAYVGYPYRSFDKVDVSVDVHATFGLAWNFQKFPLDLFVEVAPGLLVFPGLGVGWHGIIGGRFYF